ncbi:MAG: uroporphyrinogen decarboxylase family protein [Oscillospiraceae bacterium]|nr:uroporphyrinogen decarboxylase family protein [Oscillospiraceae bacterium]MDD4414310.1 uroporphyrinogen decarboxylase family protein [Oscillospiraceae bacterium]
MTNWFSQMIAFEEKKAMPILFFPSIQLLNISVVDLISDSKNQANGMRLISDKVNSAASVSMMDLSVEAECFGSKIKFFDDEVPTVIGGIITYQKEAEALEVPKVGSGRTGIYIEAIKQAKDIIKDKPVFAGAIGPFSLAGRLMDVSEAMINCYDAPDMVHTLLEKGTEFIIEYCKSYKAVGANGVIIAEPLAGLLSPALAEEFSSAYVKKIVDAVKDDFFAVVYHNCGGATIQMIESVLGTNCSAYHFGDAIDMRDMMPRIPENVVAMGNISPAKQFRNGTVDSISEETLSLLKDCTKYSNFVISSGCDIPPLAKWENIDAFFNTVDRFYKEMI